MVRLIPSTLPTLDAKKSLRMSVASSTPPRPVVLLEVKILIRLRLDGMELWDLEWKELSFALNSSPRWTGRKTAQRPRCCSKLKQQLYIQNGTRAHYLT